MCAISSLAHGYTIEPCSMAARVIEPIPFKYVGSKTFQQELPKKLLQFSQLFLVLIFRSTPCSMQNIIFINDITRFLGGQNFECESCGCLAMGEKVNQVDDVRVSASISFERAIPRVYFFRFLCLESRAIMGPGNTASKEPGVPLFASYRLPRANSWRLIFLPALNFSSVRVSGSQRPLRGGERASSGAGYLPYQWNESRSELPTEGDGSGRNVSVDASLGGTD